MNKLSDILEPLNTSGKPKTLAIGSTYPHTIDREYTADLRKIVKAIALEVKSKVLPELKEQIKARDTRNDSEEERADALIDVLNAMNGINNFVFTGESLAEKYASKTYLSNEGKITSAIEKSTGIAIRLPLGDQTLANDWIANNTLLIKDMQTEYLAKINKRISAGFTQGKTYQSIAKEIQKETGMTWRRAKLISRNEIGNLNAQINQERNKELGITKATWVSVMDERTRGNPSGKYPDSKPSHWANNGKEFEWSKGLHGELPGEPINCRCFGIAKVEY